MTEVMRWWPFLLLACFLFFLWRTGYRGEVIRIVGAALTLFTGSRAAHYTAGFPALLTAFAASATCALIVLRRPRPVPPEPPDDGDDHA